MSLHHDTQISNFDDKRAFRALNAGGFYSLGELYTAGRWSPKNLHQEFRALLKNRLELIPRSSARVLATAITNSLLNSQRGKGVFKVARKHYDLGNDLFTAMLDSSMSYTCGFWQSASSLEEAQNNKLEKICRKLELKGGMRVLDIGCGWGNFATYAATKYGVEVVGVTVSKEQFELASQRCQGLPVDIKLSDYRVNQGIFDCVVSIEMIEAVGKRNLNSFFSVVSESLKPGGLFLLQAISTETFSKHSDPAVDQFVVWLRKHIFPNGYLPTLTELTRPISNNYSLISIENFAADYAKTLAAWEDNFTLSWDKIKHNYDEAFRLRWLYYLAGCRAFFLEGLVDLFQIVYKKRETS